MVGLRLNIVKVSIFPELIYKFNAASNKFSASFMKTIQGGYMGIQNCQNSEIVHLK